MRLSEVRSGLAGLAVAMVLAARAGAQHEERAAHSLGTVRFPVSCTAAVQADFNRAVALLHHMTYPQARAAFEQIAVRDPRCAMAHWGVAMTLFQPLWPTRPSAEERKRGWSEAEKAASLTNTARESSFVASVAEFFREPGSNDYWARIQRWTIALERLHTAYPRDPEASAFYALALLASVPANEVSSPNQARAASLLLDIYKQIPDHPGAMHYIVHADDVPGREREQLAIVRKYAAAAPRNPHALHMPTHIYTRLGQWNDVIDGNLRAADAALETPAGDRGQFVWDEFPHAVEYLVYAYLQLGANDKALVQIKRLDATPNLQPTFKTAFHLASTKARYAVERQDWSEAAALTPREPASLDWDRFPWAEGVTWFARGLGSARLGRAADARLAADRLDTLGSHARAMGEDLFARSIDILSLDVRAWVAQAEHDPVTALAVMRRAAALEASTPKHAVTPAPTIPAQELLGDMLAEQGKAAEARVAYSHALELHPNRRNSLRCYMLSFVPTLGAQGTPAPAAQRPNPMILTISGWPDGGQIPVRFTQAGEQISPELKWSNVPAGTQSFVVNMLDPDVSIQGGTETQPHWIVWNIPGTATGLAEGVKPGGDLPDGSHQISATGPQYRGPGAAANGPLHHYTFEVYALDIAKLDVTASTSTAPVTAALETRAAVMKAMQGHVLGKAVYVGLFKRPQ